jgi:signal transduction histidine kinase/ABC-type amino acid transport substrate-binding protein/ActR/RegA family two-component response regulator
MTGKNRGCAFFCVLLSALFATMAAGNSNTPDLLTPAEHLWLTNNRPRIVLAIEIGYPPFVFLDSNHQPTGLAHDYLRLLESKLGIQFNQKRFSSLEAILTQAHRGKVHIVNAITKTPSRSTFLNFTDPFVLVPNVIIVRKENLNPMRETDLSGIKVSLVKSYAVTEYLTNKCAGLVPDLVADDLMGLLNVSFGRSDAAVIDLATASYLISQKGITNLRVAGEVAFGIQLSIGTPTSEPLLHHILQKGVGSITDDERQAIRDRWINKSSQGLLSAPGFWVATGSLLFISLAVIAGILAWNRILRREVTLRTTALATEKEFLRESETRLKLALSAAEAGIWEWNKDTHREIWSEELWHLFNLDRYAWKPSLEALIQSIHPDDRSTTEAAIRAATQGGREINIEWRVNLPDAPSQATRWLMARGQPERDSTGRVFAYRGIVINITDRKRAEEAREQLQSQLNQAQKMEFVGRLAGGVAHDFNNMLGVILGHTEMALEQVEKTLPIAMDLQEIRNAAERSADLTRQLLIFARKQTVTPKIIDLNETVEGMLKMLRRIMGEDIALTWLPGIALWPVKIDPPQLDQVLANLCVNARDAITGVGHISIETDNVVFDADEGAKYRGIVPGEYVLLSVSDDGCGMDKETLDKLFEPFFTTKGIGKGTGLGMATVYGIIKQNNGFINIYSEPDKGTTLKIYLPRQEGEVERSQPEGPVTPAARGHEMILLVEDEMAILNMGKKMLESLGYRVVAANTPGKAVDLAEKYGGEIQLLMSDVVMPEMNGRDLANRLFAHNPKLKILFMSGYTADVIAHHGVLDPSMHFIQKPFSIKDLSDKVREALEKRASD